MYRRFDLAAQVYEDTRTIFDMGKRAILRCLLQTRLLLEKDDVKRTLNRLYLDDYCVWIQTVKTQAIQALATRLRKVDIIKEDMDWPLTQIEEIVDAPDDESNQSGEDEGLSDQDNDSRGETSDEDSINSNGQVDVEADIGNKRELAEAADTLTAGLRTAPSRPLIIELLDVDSSGGDDGVSASCNSVTKNE